MGEVVSFERHWRCSKCKTDKPESEFYARRVAGRRRQVQAQCKSCMALRETTAKRKRQKKQWTQTNRERVNGYHREYHAKRVASDEKYVQMKRNASKHSKRKAKYGITKEQFEGMVILQKGQCAICRGHFGLTLRVDHDHNTGDVRGLLCANCNSGIGLLQESPKIFDAAKRYLAKR